MAKHDPAGDVDEASPVPFGDPFGPYPEQPYPGSAPIADTPADDDIDPPTDPALPVVTADDGFDPVAPDAFWVPERPWYREKQATLAFAAIGVAGVAILVAAVLLVALDSDDSEPSTTTPSTSTSLPTTTALTSSQPSEPPPPPPPPPESPPPAPPQGTWYPRYPQQNDGGRPNVTTPQTRPPQISVRPTHRPAFPNQPGGG